MLDIVSRRQRQHEAPTVETLVRYAEAVGERLVVSLADVGGVQPLQTWFYDAAGKELCGEEVRE